MRYDDVDDFEEPDLSKNLKRILGDEGYLLLVENLGGLRLYVPRDPSRSKTLCNHIRIENVRLLAKSEYAGNYIRVPLDRYFRTVTYVGWGYSYSHIARLLGITESGVDQLVARVKADGEYPSVEVDA